MHIELRPIATIRSYENNPRVNDQAVDAVAASIREFDFRQPIVIDEEGVIVVGHTRYKAALKLGLEKVPVHVAKGLTPAQLKAYRIADNQSIAAQADGEAGVPDGVGPVVLRCDRHQVGRVHWTTGKTTGRPTCEIS